MVGNPGVPAMHMAGGEGIGIESARQCKLHGIPYKDIFYHNIIMFQTVVFDTTSYSRTSSSYTYYSLRSRTNYYCCSNYRAIGGSCYRM